MIAESLIDEEGAMTEPGKPRVAVPSQYRGLHKYLLDRYADTVVLTFGQIEDLLGFALPDDARRLAGWWSNDDAANAPSDQSLSWTQAGRTATPRLLAHNVAFDRLF
jgi:hypothetical protein